MLPHALGWLWGKPLVTWSGCLASEQSSEWAASDLDPGQGFDRHSVGVGIGLTVLAGL